MSIDYSAAPDGHGGTWKRWIELGIPPGSGGQTILQSINSGDFSMAMKRADPLRKACMLDLVLWIKSNFPAESYGDRLTCLAWLDRHGVPRSRWEV